MGRSERVRCVFCLKCVWVSGLLLCGDLIVVCLLVDGWMVLYMLFMLLCVRWWMIIYGFMVLFLCYVLFVIGV